MLASVSSATALAGSSDATSRAASTSTATTSRRSAAANRCESVHLCKLGPQNRVAHERGRLVRTYDGLLVSAREAQVARRAREPCASTNVIGRKFGGPLQGSRGSNVRRSFLRARGGIVERSDDVDVVLDGGRRQMPGAAIVVLAIAGKRGGKGAVRIPALARCSSTVDRRADERMPELEPSAVDDDEPRLLRRAEPAQVERRALCAARVTTPMSCVSSAAATSRKRPASFGSLPTRS